ncbi:DUF4245 domain-containing protein [Blastococcus xanthinilyticus]|uniref:Uncharacterized protein DUF4245 n=1 Tax=Blastococcus xanthinilyticus TaxID=1564164 RepID=A0A5S5CMP6_9ACTN|nr:DUF4245 domain-containing protein [Blastococcus xanthinilyticus]TYP80686.1 uncharacterized protein DUF4245 [Blastococcus xanthinilyticus]
MTGIGPTSQRPPLPDDAAAPQQEPPPAASAVERANRMSAANMIRSLLPLIVICLLVVGWQAFLRNPEDPVLEIDPTNTLRLADARAGYGLLVPEDLDEGYRPTSARTDAGNAAEGEPVTLQIGYLTPSGAYAGFVVSDDPEAEALTAVLGTPDADGDPVEIDGEQWLRSTTARGETALSRTEEGVTLLVSGSADEDELRTVAGAVEPYEG